MVDHRPGERDAPRILLGQMVGDRKAAHLVNRGGVGKDRSRMAVIAHAQRHQIKARTLGALQPEAVPQLRLVARCGYLRLQLALDAVNLFRAQGTWSSSASRVMR